MLKKILRFIKENSLFSAGGTVVVAVSGGADSVALLDILASLPELKLNLVAAHMNHLLRGAESDGDEEFVRKLAESYGVPILVKRVDVAESARRERRSLEDAGRVARYAFFDEVAALHQAHAVALAHHADDQAETVLLRLLRGAGGSGLCAMAPRSAGRYVRPLLGVTRGEIEAYLLRRELTFRTDSSNADMDFLRNRIRHELIPSLARYNPAIAERLTGTARALAADEEFLEAATDAAFARHVTLSSGRVLMALPGVRSEPRGIRLRLYRRVISQAKGDLLRVGFQHLQDIDRLVFSSKPHLTLVLPDRLQMARSYEEISFALAEEKKQSFNAEFFVDRPGIYPLPGGGSLAVDYVIPPDDLRSVPATTAWFDPAKAPFPWLVRSFRPGDRLSPFGMVGQKKVKDLFIDTKLPVASRRRIPLLFCGATLLWVGGVRVSNAACLTERTESAVRVEIIGFAPDNTP
jgi:tRNA(Ile)-lysidine synthase